MESKIIEKDGSVIAELHADTFKVKLEDDHEVLCRRSGKMRKNRIRISKGDKVKIEMSSLNLSVGRIIYRHKE